MHRTIKGHIKRRRRIADDVWEVTFGIFPANFGFTAGQYVSVGLPELSSHRIPDQYHDFSIVNPPSVTNELTVAFRESASIFKTALLSRSDDMPVTIDGPKGVFTLPAHSERPLVFIAGGIGITPFVSMLRHASETGVSQPIDLYYHNSAGKSAPYLPLLRRLQGALPHFTLREITGAPDTPSLARLATRHCDAAWYLAGSQTMIIFIHQTLRGCGILDESNLIITESFTGIHDG